MRVRFNVCVSVCAFFFSLFAEFPMPKTELVQKFHVLYLGMTSVSRPIGKSLPILHSARPKAPCTCLTARPLMCSLLRYGHHQRGHRKSGVLHGQRGLDSCHTEHRWHHSGRHQGKGKSPFAAVRKERLVEQQERSDRAQSNAVFIFLSVRRRRRRRCWWSVEFVSCPSWAWGGMCTRLPSSWTPAASISTAMRSGATPTQATCPRPCRQHAWWARMMTWRGAVNIRKGILWGFVLYSRE